MVLIGYLLGSKRFPSYGLRVQNLRSNAAEKSCR
jgi:hypothetical protein